MKRGFMIDPPEADSRQIKVKKHENYLNDLMELHEIAIGFEQLERWRIRSEIPEKKAWRWFRKRFRSLEKAAVVIRSHRILLLNRNLRLLLGYPAKKAVGTLFSTHVCPSELPRVANNYLKRLAGEEDAEAVYSTILLNKKQVQIPVKLQVSKIVFLGKPLVLGILSRLEGSDEGIPGHGRGMKNTLKVSEPPIEND